MSSKVMTVVEKEFIFRNTSDELYNLLNSILSFIKTNTADNEYGNVSGKCKLVLVELFTNALKHSDADETIISLEVSGDYISINKSDRGRPFYIPKSRYSDAIYVPLKKEIIGNKTVVYQDDMSSLYCVAENSTKLSFVVKDHDVDVPPIPSNLLEHFGLMIIAKAADKFTFTFTPETGTNTFSAHLKLQNF